MSRDRKNDDDKDVGDDDDGGDDDCGNDDNDDDEDVGDDVVEKISKDQRGCQRWFLEIENRG